MSPLPAAMPTARFANTTPQAFGYGRSTATDLARIKKSTHSESNLMVLDPNLFNFETDEADINLLLQYLKQQRPEVLEQVAQSASSEVRQIITHNVQGLVGLLPSEEFNVQIVTDRENMANLLASAMMTGYFLRRMEQRMELDASLNHTGTLHGD